MNEGRRGGLQTWGVPLNVEQAKALSYPRQVMIQTTSRCNSACVICPYPQVAKTGPRGDMDPRLFASLIDQIADFPPLERMMLYLMNEPLCDKQIAQHIRYARSKLPATEIYILTNGIGLTDTRVDELLEAGLTWIGLSVHAIEPKTYARITGRKDFDAIKARLARFVERALDRHGPDFVQVNVTRIRPYVSEQEFDRAADYWRSLGLTRVDLDNGYISRAGNVRVHGHDPIRRDRIVGCDTVWSYIMMHLLFDGAVIPCCMDWRRKVVFGNADGQRLIDIWRGPRRLAFLNAIGSGKKLPEGFLCTCCEDAVPAPVAESTNSKLVEENPPEKIEPAQDAPTPDKPERTGDPLADLMGRFAGLEDRMQQVMAHADSSVQAAAASQEQVPAAPKILTRQSISLLAPGHPLAPTTGPRQSVDVALVLLPPWDIELPPIELGTAAAACHQGDLAVCVEDCNIRWYDLCGDYLRGHWRPEARARWSENGAIDQVLAFAEPAIGRWIEAMVGHNPRVIAYLVGDENLDAACRLAPRLRNHLPDATALLFGPVVNNVAALASIPPGIFAGVVRPQDYQALADWVRRILSVNDPSDAAVRERNTAAASMEPPGFEGFELSLYTTFDLPIRFAILEAEDFFSTHDPRAMIDRIRSYKDRLVAHRFRFVDRNLSRNPAALRGLCDAFVEAGLTIAWSAKVAAGKALTDSLLTQMARAGCERLELLGHGDEAQTERICKAADAAGIKIDLL